MRIVNVIQRYEPAVGGSETWCREVCRYLASRGHNVKVLTMDVNKEEEFWRDPPDEDHRLAMGRYFIDQGVVVRRYRRSLPIFTLYHLFYKKFLDYLCRIYFYGPHSAEMYAKMWRDIKSADVIFLHTLPYPHNFVALAFAKYFRKPTVIVPHFHPGHSAYERPTEYWLMRRCDIVLADSDYEKQYLMDHGVRGEHLHVPGVGIHPSEYVPTDLESFRVRMKQAHGMCQGDLILTFVGRKMPDKGVDHLIKAVQQLKSKIPLKLFLVGPSFEWFTRLYEELPSEDKKVVIDLGVVSHQEKVNLLHMSDMLLLPSKFEAFGIVLLESWICGVPVLGTTQGAMPSIIGDEGYVVRYGDVNDLREKILMASKKRESLKEMGARGRKKVLDRYTWEEVGRRTEQGLQSAAGRKKILLCANAYPPNFIGGAELIAHYQALEMRRRGCDVQIFAGDPNAHAKRHSIRTDHYQGLTVHRVCLHPRDYSFEFDNFSHATVEAHFEAVLKAYNPDVVHFHNIVGLSVGLVHLAKRRGIRTVVTLHDHWGFCFKNTLMKRENEICSDYTKCAECRASISNDLGDCIPVRLRSDFMALQLAEVDTFITPSTYLAEAYIGAGFPREKFQVIWYGIDVRHFSERRKSDPRGTVRFTFIGYLGRHKGVHTLLEALSLFGDKSKIRVNLVGEGDQLPLYKQMVREMGWEGSVRFWGKVDNTKLDQVYEETDVIILPSVWPENQPVSITEAMAARRPVIASRMGGIPELIEDGRSGYLFDAGDAIQLAARMKEFVDQPAKMKEFGENGYPRISDKTFEKQVGIILETYEPENRSAQKKPQHDTIIVCVGKNFDSHELEVMDNLKKKVRLVKREWLQDDQLSQAAMVWVLDDTVVLEDVILPLQFKLPLLVPLANQQLSELCRSFDCGYSYSCAAEAVAFLETVTADQSLRTSLGERAFRVVTAS